MKAEPLRKTHRNQLQRGTAPRLPTHIIEMAATLAEIAGWQWPGEFAGRLEDNADGGQGGHVKPNQTRPATCEERTQKA